MQQIFQTLKSAQQAYRNNNQNEAIILLNQVVQQLPREHLSLSAVQMAFGVMAILALLLKQAGEAQPSWLLKTIQQLQIAVQNQQGMSAEQLVPLRTYLGELSRLLEKPSTEDTLDAPLEETHSEHDVTHDTTDASLDDRQTEIPDTPVQSTSTDETSVQDDGTLMFLTSQIEALGAGPATVGMLLMRAEIYSRQNSWQAAITDYKAALAMSPDNASLYAKLAATYELAGVHEQAIAAAEQVLSLDPNDADYTAAQSILERLQTHV